MDKLFSRMPLPSALTYEFLGTFARFEYALKAGGFAKSGKSSVEADWDLFSSDIDWHFRRIKDDTFKSAVDFLLNSPPRKQVLRDGCVDWKESPPDKNLFKAQQVMIMVRRVRNNLFHGAKIWSPDYINRERDIRLLESALCVINQCVLLNKKVYECYGDGVF